MTHLARHSLIGIVFILAFSLRPGATGELTLFGVAWGSQSVGESAPAPPERLLLERDPVLPEEAPIKPGAERQLGPPAKTPDYRGAARDAAYFVGYQIVGVAVLAAAPESVSG
jgi:hypothetical protein